MLIQFGHNDGGPLDDRARARGSIRGTGGESRDIDNPTTGRREVVRTYGWYMRKYIGEARAKGMVPIVCSPVPRCPKKPIDPAAERGGYVKWSAEVADGERALFVDLHRLVLERYAALDSAEVKAKYFTPADDTHTSAAGAELNAACVAEGILALKDCRLADCLREEPAPTSRQ